MLALSVVAILIPPGSVLREMATHLKTNYTESFNAAARAFELVLESPSDTALKLEAYYRCALY